jgi:hypothetical protein
MQRENQQYQHYSKKRQSCETLHRRLFLFYNFPDALATADRTGINNHLSFQSNQAC